MTKLQKIWSIIVSKEKIFYKFDEKCKSIGIPKAVLNAKGAGEVRVGNDIYFQEYPFFVKVERNGHVFRLQSKDPHYHYVTVEGGDILSLIEFMDKYKNP